MDLQQIEDFFVDSGGQFVTSAFNIRERLANIRAFVYDWDGVFNDGRKGVSAQSDFTEVDSMGTNMLRYAHYRQGQNLPLTAVITGEINPSAEKWVAREHIDCLYGNAKNKSDALAHFCAQFDLEPRQVAYFYDDLLDIPVAQAVGLRFAVGRLANPVFISYLEQNGLADYISATQGNEHAVREFSELLLALYGEAFEIFKQRADYSEDYRQYLAQRQNRSSRIFEFNNDEINEREPKF